MRQPLYLNLIFNGCALIGHGLNHFADFLDEGRIV
jgi:hypothetical protein